MSLFLKLILAHLIADFILQFEELYKLKVRSHLGHFFHAAIHGLLYFALAWPYLSRPWIVLFLAALAIIHHFQDILKYAVQHKHPKTIFYCFTIDQIIHFLWIALVFVIPSSNPPAGFPGHPQLNAIYQDDFWTLAAIAFISAAFKEAYLLHAFRKTFFPEGTRPLHFISSFEITHGIIERTWVLGCFLFLPWPAALAITPIIGLLRLTRTDLKNALDFGLSFGASAVTGILFKAWMGSL